MAGRPNIRQHIYPAVRMHQLPDVWGVGQHGRRLPPGGKCLATWMHAERLVQACMPSPAPSAKQACCTRCDSSFSPIPGLLVQDRPCHSAYKQTTPGIQLAASKLRLRIVAFAGLYCLCNCCCGDGPDLQVSDWLELCTSSCRDVHPQHLSHSNHKPGLYFTCGLFWLFCQTQRTCSHMCMAAKHM